MKLIEIQGETSGAYEEGLAIAIGAFDGCHLGHQAVLGGLKESAYPHKAVLTFSETFKFQVSHKKEGRFLQTLDQKAKAFEAMGLTGNVYWIGYPDGGKRVADWPKETFCRFLKANLGVKGIYVGTDFRFGANGEGTVEDLKASGFDVHAYPLMGYRGEKIGSSRIIQDLENGDIASVNAMLGRPYAFSQTVIHGLANGRKLGFPTANQPPIVLGNYSQAIPANGVYATEVAWKGKAYPAMTNVGIHPTVDALKTPIVETNVIGFDGDLYGAELTVGFLSRLRPEQRFESLDELIRRMAQDQKDAIRVFDGWKTLGKKAF